MDTLRTVRDVLIASHGAFVRNVAPKFKPEEFAASGSGSGVHWPGQQIAADLPRENTELAVRSHKTKRKSLSLLHPRQSWSVLTASAPAEHRPSQSPRYADHFLLRCRTLQTRPRTPPHQIITYRPRTEISFQSRSPERHRSHRSASIRVGARNILSDRISVIKAELDKLPLK